MDNILLVEDDRPLALGFIYTLQKEGFNILHATNLRQAREYIDENIDLILLDVMLPDGTGYEFCEETRNKGFEMPIIFTTACDEESNIVMGLDIGADDYITKPVRLKELISRINANLRKRKKIKNNINNKHVLESEDLKIDLLSHEVIKNEEEVILTLSEYKLLLILMENSPNVMSRNILLEKLWDVEGDFVEGNTLNVYIKRLREKIEDDLKSPYYIQTVRGIGYKFNPEVRRV
ncbi:DNA-binding response regulator [Romboutsia maritimum]|uniref:Stage 0 sporulation protein A homolog n=1 Tax=Romboutsia maritimum TaxID=2020948 RepID=A0A371IRW5_9FIRM|nr:response regulator transcription factor [Romboutsia maritimum]RDY23226.1 DNA-binding response regulator [Romboutsia maritimum]